VILIALPLDVPSPCV